MHVSHKSIRCNRCFNPISFFSIAHWVNSGINQLRCKNCNSIVLNELYLLADYVLSGLYVVFLFNEIEAIKTIFFAHEWLAVVIIIVSGVFILYFIPILLIFFKKK